MVVRRRQELELRVDVGDVGLDRLRGQEQAIGDRLVRTTLGHEGEDLALTLGEVIERHLRAPAADELGDDLGVDHRAAAGDPPDRVGEVVEILDAVLQEVADAARPMTTRRSAKVVSTYCERTRIPTAVPYSARMASAAAESATATRGASRTGLSPPTATARGARRSSRSIPPPDRGAGGHQIVAVRFPHNERPVEMSQKEDDR